MEIYLDQQAMKQIRSSIADAIEEGDVDTLREDLIESFSDEQVEQLELRVEAADIYDFVCNLLDEWSGDDESELLELLEDHLTEADVDFRYFRGNVDDESDSASANGDDDDDDDSQVSLDDESGGIPLEL